MQHFQFFAAPVPITAAMPLPPQPPGPVFSSASRIEHISDSEPARSESQAMPPPEKAADQVSPQPQQEQQKKQLLPAQDIETESPKRALDSVDEMKSSRSVSEEVEEDEKGSDEEVSVPKTPPRSTTNGSSVSASATTTPLRGTALKEDDDLGASEKHEDSGSGRKLRSKSGAAPSTEAAADLLMYLATSPSGPVRSTSASSVMQQATAGTASGTQQQLVLGTPSTPSQSFNLHEYLNLFTPSPARGGGSTNNNNGSSKTSNNDISSSFLATTPLFQQGQGQQGQRLFPASARRVLALDGLTGSPHRSLFPADDFMAAISQSPVVFNQGGNSSSSMLSKSFSMSNLNLGSGSVGGGKVRRGSIIGSRPSRIRSLDQDGDEAMDDGSSDKVVKKDESAPPGKGVLHSAFTMKETSPKKGEEDDDDDDDDDTITLGAPGLSEKNDAERDIFLEYDDF